MLGLARISAMESAIFEVEMWRQEKTHAKTFDYLTRTLATSSHS